MKLSDKQWEFAQTITELESWLKRIGWKWVRGEGFRSAAEARRLASLGLGIINSNHCRKLAQDLYIFDPDGDPWNPTTYEVVAEKWLTLDARCRAGHYFVGRGDSPGRDSVHFSFIHNGVQ